MFGNSIALVQTHDKYWFAHLHSLVRQAGFKESRVFPENSATLSQYRRGPVPFIFVHAGAKPAAVLKVFTSVRSHPDVCVRFLPIIAVTDTGAAATVMRFIQMGCDDVVSLPLTAASLIDRLKRQIGRPRAYYQTRSYFGPDQRPSGSSSQNGSGGDEQFFRHFMIQRHVQRGVTILSTDVHFPSGKEHVPQAAKSA